MSYWIYLQHPETQEIAEVETHSEGGTYVIGGIPYAEINVTYNYYKYFDFRGLHGRTGKETIPELEKAVAELGTDKDPDYWKSTPGNAGYTCNILLQWAKLHPSYIWEVH